MSPIDPEQTLAELVLEKPGRALAFEKLQLDYCCGGQSSLAEVAAQRGLDPRTLSIVLEAAEDAADVGREERDWGEASMADLCGHIVDVHHAYLRQELPQIGMLLTKVVDRHGDALPALRELQLQFAGLQAELIDHIDREEERLFPLCRRLDVGVDAGAVMPELGMHESAHAKVGDTLALMRELAGGYRPEQALCTTHGVLLASLGELELDLHQHIHEENNVLFPRLRDLLALDPSPAR